MPINEQCPAISLMTNPESISQQELQNRQGMRRISIEGLSHGKYLTILAVETDLALSTETYFSLLETLKTGYGVIAMQTLFGTDIPNDESFRNDLYVSAHLRMNRPTPQIEQEIEE